MLRDADLLAHITRLPHSRATFKQLVRELAARGEQRDELEKELERLAARGDLIEARSGHYVVSGASTEYTVGRLRVHRDGYALRDFRIAQSGDSRATCSSHPIRRRRR